MFHMLALHVPDELRLLFVVRAGSEAFFRVDTF